MLTSETTESVDRKKCVTRGLFSFGGAAEADARALVSLAMVPIFEADDGLETGASEPTAVVEMGSPRFEFA